MLPRQIEQLTNKLDSLNTRLRENVTSLKKQTTNKKSFYKRRISLEDHYKSQHFTKEINNKISDINQEINELEDRLEDC